jgi:hypothetical protein
MTDDRFWKYVEKTDSCWVWTGLAKTRGYGRISRAIDKKPHYFLAHRYSWMLRHGPIPDGQHVLHKCDTPVCVNPDHLFLGTHQENMADMWAKGRQNLKVRQRGEARHNAKLNAESVKEIRRLTAAGERRADIAARFHVSKSLVNQVARGDWWKHV